MSFKAIVDLRSTVNKWTTPFASDYLRFRRRHSSLSGRSNDCEYETVFTSEKYNFQLFFLLNCSLQEEWPHSKPNLSPSVLADNGFYFTGASGQDEVQCFACGKVLDGWEPDDDVAKVRIYPTHIQNIFNASAGTCKDLTDKGAVGFLSDPSHWGVLVASWDIVLRD